jgi:glutamate racemase
VPQGEIVALSLKDYLTRHTWMEEKLAQNGLVTYLTTENPETFEEKAELFLGTSISANRVVID